MYHYVPRHLAESVRTREILSIRFFMTSHGPGEIQQSFITFMGLQGIARCVSVSRGDEYSQAFTRDHNTPRSALQLKTLSFIS